MKKHAPNPTLVVVARTAALVFTVFALLWGNVAQAQNTGLTVRRYAVVIGSNLGEPDEAPLMYAERDANRIGDALTRLSGVAPENLIRLIAPDRLRVTAAFAAMRERIAADKAKTGVSPLLFVYYSGHAGAGSLHLGGSTMTFGKLKRQVQAVGAAAAVFVIDACRSGGMTRVKGAKPAAPFEITAENLDSQGLAIITSSAAAEDAQESDRLRGGIFTHHLLAGLHGAADTSRDKRVTLSEAYRYAYVQTLQTTTRTRFVQHPTYSFNIKGRQELVLSRLDRAAGLGQLRLPKAGRYILIEQGRSTGLIAEVAAKDGTRVLVVPGRYLVRHRENRAVLEANLTIRAGVTTTLSASDMVRVPYGQTVRKGLAEDQVSVWSLGASFEVGGPLLPATSTGLFGAVALQLDLHELALQARLRYGRAWASNSEVEMGQGMLGFDLAALHLFDIPQARMAIGLGVRLGGDWVSQRFDSRGKAPARSQFVGRVAPVLRVEFAVTAAFTIALDAGVDVYLLEEIQTLPTGVTTEVVPFGTLGFMVYL